MNDVARCDICHHPDGRPRTDYTNVSDAARWIERLCLHCAARFDHSLCKHALRDLE